MLQGLTFSTVAQRGWDRGWLTYFSKEDVRSYDLDIMYADFHEKNLHKDFFSKKSANIMPKYIC